MNITDNEGIPLLHQAILRQCTDAALFLLNQDIDINARFAHLYLIFFDQLTELNEPKIVRREFDRFAARS